MQAFVDVTASEQEHWAKKEISTWSNYGVVSGYDDGTFKPDQPISRAELSRMINSIFGYYKLSSEQFADLQQNDWFYQDALIGVQAGYIQQDEVNAFNPYGYITREQFSVIMQDVFELSGEGNEQILTSFHDAQLINDEAKSALSVLLAQDLLHGYEDGNLRPQQYITRAETIALLDNMVEHVFSEPGTYKDQTFSHSVIVNNPDITLTNMTIGGNLYISDGVKEGEVYLNNVDVKGSIIVTGGGENSIYFNDATAQKTIVNKEDGNIRLVASGSTNISNVDIQSGVILEEEELDVGNTGFINAEISGNIPINSEVSFLGDFDSIDINSQVGLNVTLENCFVKELAVIDALEQEVNSQITTSLTIMSSTISELLSKAHGAKISIANTSKINDMILQSETTLVLKKGSSISNIDVEAGAEGSVISGEGTIGKLKNNAEKIIVNGKEVLKGQVIDFSPPSGDGSSNSGSGSDDPSSPSYDAGTLVPDTTNNVPNEAIEIVMSSGSDYWKNNISKLMIDDKPIPIAWYSINENSITLDAKVFYSKRSNNLAYSLTSNDNSKVTSLLEYDYAAYDIDVHAAGYDPVSVEQRIVTADKEVSVTDAGLYYFKDYNTGIKPIRELEELTLQDSRQYYPMFLVSNGENDYVDATTVEGTTVTWTVLDTNVVEVDDLGLVTGIGYGETDIIADFGGYSDTMNVKVGKETPTIIKDSTNNADGQDIEVTFTPQDAAWFQNITGVYLDNQEVTFTAANNVITIPAAAFAAIDANTKELRYSDSSISGSVTQHTYGVYDLDIKSTGYVSASVWQDIYQKTEDVGIDQYSITYDKGKDEDNALTLEKDYDNTMTLYADIMLSNGQQLLPGMEKYFDYEEGGMVIDHQNLQLGIQWSSNTPQTANVDNTGMVSAVASGLAKIQSQYAGKSSLFDVIVNGAPPELKPDLNITIGYGECEVVFSDPEWAKWAAAITGVYILDKDGNEQLLSPQAYKITQGKITLNVNQMYYNYEESGNRVVYLTIDNALIKATDNIYNIYVKANYYSDATVIQPIYTGQEQLVSLQKDTTDTTLGQPIEIGFNDNVPNMEFEDTIVSIRVNDTIIPQSMFDIQSDKVVIDPAVFTSSGAYVIKVDAMDANGVFDLDDYYLQVTQVIMDNPLTPQFAYAEGNDLFVWVDESVNTEQPIFLERSDNMTVQEAVYNSVSGDVYNQTDFHLLPYTTNDMIVPEDYTVNGSSVIMFGSETVGQSVYGKVYGLDGYTDIEINIDNGTTLVHGNDSIPNDAKPLQVDDIITMRYKNEIILQRKWDGSQWIPIM
ncbi:S-layer homology domain-containing protein [Longirhabdus pacifica]|uniref:S-layer homology domain-containing protein n=1 Tax=Longirhabdus pacifica TaxID=2305227 RepID=UPI0013E8AFAD|nr:S-layer homology domain-containing protein [Longirhabdus pacifica]